MTTTLTPTKRIHTFGNRANLVTEGARVNRRLNDLMTDPAIFDNDTANRAFCSVYSDVRDRLREVMFDGADTLVWTLAVELERAGHMVYKSDNGIDLKVGTYTLNIPAPCEPDYLSVSEIEMLAAIVNIGNGEVNATRAA